MSHDTQPRMISTRTMSWLAAPVLSFALASLVTKQLLSAEPSVEPEPVHQAVATSLERLEQGDREGGLAGLAGAGARVPQDMGVQAALIAKFQQLGEYALAAQAIERTLRAAPAARQTAPSYAGLCEFLAKHGDLDGAARILASDLMPRWPDAFETAYIQARLALDTASDTEALEQAARQLELCVNRQPEHLPSKLQLASACSRLGQPQRAEGLLRAVLERDPLEPTARKRLDELLATRARSEDASQPAIETPRVNPAGELDAG